MKLSELISKAEQLLEQEGDLWVVAPEFTLIKEISLRRDPTGKLKVAEIEPYSRVKVSLQESDLAEAEVLSQEKEILEKSYKRAMRKFKDRQETESVKNVRELIEQWKETVALYKTVPLFSQKETYDYQARAYEECIEELEKVLSGDVSPIEKWEKSDG